MIIIDRMLISGIKFVLEKVAVAVDAELNDEGSLREELLAAQMRFELGEIDQAELDRIEASVLMRLRETRGGGQEALEMRVQSVEVHAADAHEEP